MLVVIGVCGIYICMIGTDQKLSHNRRSDRYTLLQVPSKHNNASCPELSSTSYFQQHYPQPKTFRRYTTTSFCVLNSSKPNIGNMWSKCHCDYICFVTNNLKRSSTLLSSSIRSEGVSFCLTHIWQFYLSGKSVDAHPYIILQFCRCKDQAVDGLKRFSTTIQILAHTAKSLLFQVAERISVPL